MKYLRKESILYMVYRVKIKEKMHHGIKDDIEDAYSKGKISELHYNLLNKKISQ